MPAISSVGQIPPSSAPAPRPFQTKMSPPPPTCIVASVNPGPLAPPGAKKTYPCPAGLSDDCACKSAGAMKSKTGTNNRNFFKVLPCVREGGVRRAFRAEWEDPAGLKARAQQRGLGSGLLGRTPIEAVGRRTKLLAGICWFFVLFMASSPGRCVIVGAKIAPRVVPSNEPVPRKPRRFGEGTTKGRGVLGSG